MTIALHGKGISRGIALGTAHIIQRDSLEVLEYPIAEGDLPAELERLSAAVEEAKQSLRAMRERIPAHTPADIASFIDTHLLMLDDPSLTEEPKRVMRQRGWTAEQILERYYPGTSLRNLYAAGSE
jgi:phosphotransferase system enzyme I (PtsI)